MSQKTTRASVSLEDKTRTDSPVREMKKKAAADKERADKEREEKKTDKPAATNQINAKVPPVGVEKNGKPAPVSEKKKETEKPNESAEKKQSVSESAKSAEAKQNGSKTPTNGAEKATNGAEKATDGAGKATNGAEKAAKSTEKATNGAEKAADGTEKQGNGGDKDKPGEAIELDVEHEDEQFPELAYDDGSDDDPIPSARSVTRRSQVKAARTPETPRPASNKPPAEDKSADIPPTAENESKLLKMRDEFTPSSMKLRSADPVTDKADESKTDDEEGKLRADESITLKTDTNFSKSRIKVSPYRRSTRLQDSLVANYTGNNSTMEMDISETSEQAESTHVSRRSIRGRRSYKTLGEFVPSPRRKDITIGADFRPTVHVVGRKRKTAEDDDDTGLEFPSTLEDLAAPEAPVKRMRLFERVVTPFSSLLRRRTVASSTPLPLRRSQAIVGINSDLPLHGDVQIAPEALPATPAEAGVLKTESEVLKTMPVEVAEIATETQDVQSRQKCAVM